MKYGIKCVSQSDFSSIKGWEKTCRGSESWCNGSLLDDSYGPLRFADINKAYVALNESWPSSTYTKYFVEEYTD